MLLVVSLLVYLVYRATAFDFFQQFNTLESTTILFLAMMMFLQYPSRTSKVTDILRYWIEINFDNMAVWSHVNTLKLAESPPHLHGFRRLQGRLLSECMKRKRLPKLSSTIYVWFEIARYFIAKSSVNICTDLLVVLSLLEYTVFRNVFFWLTVDKSDLI